MKVGSLDPCGLANNLKSLISAKNLYDNASPYWTKQDYNSLFKPVEQIKPEARFFDWKFRLKELELLPDNFNAYYLPGCRRDGRNIDHMFMYVPMNIRSHVTESLWRLEPNDTILASCYDFYQKHKWKVSVHYRSFDTDHHDKYDFGHTDKYLLELLDSIPKTQIFLATDNRNKGLSFINKTKHDFVSFDAGFPPSQSALCDMLLLGFGDLLFSPQFSTFSELSWYWGYCRQDVCNYKSADYLLEFETVWHKGSQHANYYEYYSNL